jgi:hypothetical protein
MSISLILVALRHTGGSGGLTASIGVFVGSLKSLIAPPTPIVPHSFCTGTSATTTAAAAAAALLVSVVVSVVGALQWPPESVHALVVRVYSILYWYTHSAPVRHFAMAISSPKDKRNVLVLPPACELYRMILKA